MGVDWEGYGCLLSEPLHYPVDLGWRHIEYFTLRYPYLVKVGVQCLQGSGAYGRVLLSAEVSELEAAYRRRLDEKRNPLKKLKRKLGLESS